MSFSVRLAVPKTFGDVPQRLRRAQGRLRPNLAAQLRKPTKAMYDAVRTDIVTAALPGQRVRGARRPFRGQVASRGVRRPTARALSWKVSTSAGDPRAEVEFRASKVPIRIQPLYPYWVGQKSRPRHPVMGNRSVWAGQRIPDVWKQTRALAPAARKAVKAAIDDTADIIGGRS